MAQTELKSGVEEPLADRGPTVREAMSFPGFSSATLLGGEAGLDRRIEWVRIMETPDTARFLQPGDLLLTTAFPIKDDRAAQIDLLRSLAEAGAAGLVVKPERYLRELPEEMAKEADRHEVPLFTLPTEVTWVDLMNPLLERIINAEHSRLKRSFDIHHRFTELVLDGKGMNEICRTLSELLDAAVVVEDASFHLLAHAGGSGDPHRKETIARHGTPQRVLFDPGIQAVLREVAANRGPMKVPPFPHLGMHRERIIAPITAANQTLGFISIVDPPPAQEELAFMAVEQAAIVIALAMSKEREVAEVEGRVKGEFLDDLTHATFGDDAAAQRRARHLGYPLAGLHVLIAIDIDAFRDYIRARQLSEDTIQAVKRDFHRRVTAAIKTAFPRHLLSTRSDTVYALLPLGAEAGDYRRRVGSLGEQIRDVINQWQPGFTVSVAFSGPVEAPAGAATAHREVTAVLETLARFERREQVVAVPELGLTGLLAAVNDDRLVDYAQRHLGRIAEHDRNRSGQLLETLRAYLESGEQQAAAKHLGVHPNTLRYRLDRIREVSELELDDPETRLNLSVALRIYALLGL
ncbi:MAG TPA: PucR family transcriptional regulator ligand-binding domain-containing protein [Candidatus Dormibacteraeota bacterium]